MKRLVVLIVGFFFILGFAATVSALDPGISDTEIVVGTVSALEGPSSFLGIQTNHGFMSCINAVNDTGGVNGRKIKVIAYNDGYEPLPCVQMTQKLINEDKVFMLANYVGTPTSVKAQPVWTGAKVPATGFFTGAEALRVPFNRYNVHVRASYYREAEAIIDAFVKDLGFKNIAIFYQYDAFGEAVKKGAEIALAKYGMTPVGFGNFQRNTLDIEEGLTSIVSSKPDGIVMVGTYSPLAKFVKAAKRAGLTKTIFHTVSFVGPEAFAKELGTESSGCVVTQVMPPYSNEELPIIQEFLAALQKYYPNDSPNFVNLEGFINGKVVVEGLKRAGSNLSREAYIDAIETIKTGQMGTGLGFNYGPNDHVGLEKVTISFIKDGKFVEVDKWADVK